MEPYVGEIRIFGGTFAPLGWQFCQGQLLSISEYATLFNLLGTTYGGDGQNTFAVPNLASRVVVGQGQAPGRAAYSMGQLLGVENVMLNASQLPVHGHPFTGSVGVVTGASASQLNPNNAYFGDKGVSTYNAGLGAAPATLGPGGISGVSSVVGGSQPHSNIQPVTALNYIIATEGIYPSRD
jgi:microcystin-dependent protein